MRQCRPALSAASRPSSRGARRPFSCAWRQLQRIVVHHERAEGRHGLDHAGDGGILEPMRQGEHEPAQASVDAVAELDDEGGVAGGQETGLRARGHGLSDGTGIALTALDRGAAALWGLRHR